MNICNVDPSDQIMTNELHGMMGITGGGERGIQSFGGGNLREWDNLENLGIDGRIILNSVLKNLLTGSYAGFICFRIKKVGGFLWIWQWKFGFHKILRMSHLYEKLFSSQEGLCSLELVTFVKGSWFFSTFTPTLSDSLLLWKQKKRLAVSGIAVTEGSYKFQTVSFVKINQTPVLLCSVFTFFFSFRTLLCLTSLLLSPPLPQTLLHSLLKISSYNVNWFTLFTQVSQNAIIPTFSLWTLMEFHPSFRYGSSEIAFKL